jgi:hypothetical protein
LLKNGNLADFKDKKGFLEGFVEVINKTDGFWIGRREHREKLILCVLCG